MQKFLHDTVVPNAQSSATKKTQIANMFNDISGKYDFMNRLFSGRADVQWRKKIIDELIESNPKVILDVATGTADVAILTAQMLQPSKIFGIDISEGMLNIGKQKINKLNLTNIIELKIDDSENLSYTDNYFDAVTVAYGVRNFENLVKGLSEIKRVLKPGGKLVILEASKPHNGFIKFFSDFYTLKIIPTFGNIFGGNKKAYLYLNNSIQAFPEGNQFLNILIDTGFTQTYLKRLSLGVCTIYCGKK
jgi:demethylmenaquinone methyltransferase / 2-methoxy-6-polyprenyl-1,4-benzoquinol methylase